MTAACVSCAFASAFGFARSMLNTWIVLWSDVAAINLDYLLNCKSFISALSAPRLNIKGHVGFCESTFQMRIRVPFSLAVANKSPLRFMAIAAIEP